MFHISSTVSTVSKSFSDLLGIWKSRESLHARDGEEESNDTARHSKRLSCVGTVTPSKTDVDSNKTIRKPKWKSEAGLTDKGEIKESLVGTPTPFARPQAETVSLCSFRSSNRNIGYLAKNIHTVSAQSVSQDDAQTSDKGNITTDNEGYAAEPKNTDRQSIASDSRMYTKSPMLSNQSSLIKRPPYKKKHARKDSNEHTKLRRKHDKPKSESGNEMALVQRSYSPRASTAHSKEIQTDASSSIERSRPLSVSQQSLQPYQDADSVFVEDTRRERSLSLPPGIHTYVNVDRSSQVTVTTSGASGPLASVHADRQSFGSTPSRKPMSVSSGESLSYSIRKTVADITREILDEHAASKASIVTKRLDEARKRLQQNSFLILIGYDGEGLTTLGYDLLLDYREREQYIVMERKEALPCLTQADEKKVVVFADDVFGTTYFDEKRYEGWCRDMNRIRKVMKRNGAILILGLHTKFLKEDKCKVFCDHYQENMLDISNTNLQLDFKERQSMLKCNIMSQMDVLRIEICKTKDEETITRDVECSGLIRIRISEQTIDDIARLSLASGFPGKVGDFLRSVDSVKQGLHFFTTLTKEMYKEIDSFRMAKTGEDCEIYLALVAVFVYGSLNFDTFEIHCQYLAKSEKALKNYLETCSGKSQKLGQKTKCPKMINVLTGFAKKYKCMPTLAGMVKRGVLKILGRYIKEQVKGQYVIASESVEKAVAVSCANEYPVDICKHSSKRVFNAIIGPDEAFEENIIHISVKENDKLMCQAAIDRLRLILTSNKILEFIQHPAMRVAWFAKLFIKQVKKEKHALKTMMRKMDDKCKTSLLSLSLKYPYKSPGKLCPQSLAEDLMLSGKWSSIKRDFPEFAKEMEQEYLEKCCEMGWTESYFRSVESLQLSPNNTCLSLTVNSRNLQILTDLSRNKTLTKDDWYLALGQACKKLEEDDHEGLEIIMFIKNMVPFDYKSEAEESIIHSAARTGDDLLLSKVVPFYIDKSFKNKAGLTCLHLATQGNHYYCVRQALENGASQSVPDPNGELPLHYACKLGLTEITKLFLEKDSEVVNCTSHSRSTPLHLSAGNGHFEITKVLVDNGARIESTDIKGRTPSYYAARYGTSIVLEYLLEKEMQGLDNAFETVDDQDARQAEIPIHSRKQKILKRKQNLLTTCLIDTVREHCHDKDKIDGLTHMLQMGGNLNYVKEDNPPLIQLATECNCSVEIIKFLLRNGVSVTQRDLQTGDTALHKAVKHENSDIIRLILENHLDNETLLRQRNKYNETPLHSAVTKGSVDLVELLKTESTTKEFVVKQGRCLTPLALAKERLKQSEDRSEQRKYEDVIKVLTSSSF